IHVWRSNHLRAFVSLVLAQRTGSWSSKTHAHPPDARVEISVDDFVAFAEKRRRDEAFIRDRFRGAPVCDVEYEELARDLPRALARIEMFLSIEPMSVAPTLQKQTTGSLRDRITNYEALRNALSHTEYARFFEA